jgi:serine/threonine-protein kinase
VDALVGTVVEGAYRITRLIGEGGMGAVYEAVQLRLNKRVAVKLMARDLAANREALARFHREAEITSHLGHPHLVNVVDFGQAESGEPYLVMEYLEGEDLDHRLRRVGCMPIEAVVNVVKQVASALNAAHDQGVVHRDLKPGNVFLVQIPGEPDFVKVLDFGISKMKAARTQLTNAAAVMGTPNYMSPEQATGMVEEIDHRVDQWALGCITWQMLLGRGPFVADEVAAILYQIINLDPHPLTPRVPGLPPAVEAVLRRALSKRPADRFPSLREFSRALDAAASGRPADATPAPVVASPASPADTTIAYGTTPVAGIPAPAPIAQPPPDAQKPDADVSLIRDNTHTPQDAPKPDVDVSPTEDDSDLVAPRNRIRPVHILVAAVGMLLLLGTCLLTAGRRTDKRPLPAPVAAPTPPPAILPQPAPTPAPIPAAPPPPVVASPEPAPLPPASGSEARPPVVKRPQPGLAPAAEPVDGTKSTTGAPSDVDRFLRERDPKKAEATEAATDRRANPYHDYEDIDFTGARRSNPYSDTDGTKPGAPVGGPAGERRANPWVDPFVDGADAPPPPGKPKTPVSPPAAAPPPRKPALIEEL